MAVGLVIVSHSARLAEGVVELAAQMARGAVRLVAAGGTDEGGLGTSVQKVLTALIAAEAGNHPRTAMHKHTGQTTTAPGGNRGLLSSQRRGDRFMTARRAAVVDGYWGRVHPDDDHTDRSGLRDGSRLRNSVNAAYMLKELAGPASMLRGLQEPPCRAG